MQERIRQKLLFGKFLKQKKDTRKSDVFKLDAATTYPPGGKPQVLSA